DPRRKIDPAGLDMTTIRRQIDAEMRRQPEEPDMTPNESTMLAEIRTIVGGLQDKVERRTPSGISLTHDYAKTAAVGVRALLGRDPAGIDPAEIARMVLEGLDADTLTDAQVASIIDAMPAAVKQALREGAG